jgi:hypothetical protein
MPMWMYTDRQTPIDARLPAEEENHEHVHLLVAIEEQATGRSTA